MLHTLTGEGSDSDEMEPTDPQAVAVYGMYRFYTRADPQLGIGDGARLYVGITSRQFASRWEDERRQEPTRWWWHLIDWNRTETVLLNGGKPMKRSDALRIEESAIKEIDEIREEYGTLANNHHNGMAGQRLVEKIKAVTLGSAPVKTPVPASGPPPGAQLIEPLNRLLEYGVLLVAVAILLAGFVIAAL